VLRLARPTSLAGSALATAGEEGQVKVWSRMGMVRCTLAQADGPVHALAWDQDGDSLAFCSGGGVAIKPLQGGGGGGVGPSPAPAPGRPPAPQIGSSSTGTGSRAATGVAWKAHEGSVLALDWSAISGMIVTGGEDCKYKVKAGAMLVAGS
jgi:intraflagellar transport protein 80